jgi:hypothetical protein
MPLLVELPVDPMDLAAIEQIVRENELLIPGNFRMDDAAHVMAFHEAAFIHKHSFRVLFDRNLVTRLAGLVRGDVMPTDPASARIVRFTAACMAFCILAEIDVEPNMAIYEGAQTHGHAFAEAETLLFQVANNLHPKFYIDIALGRANQLPPGHIEEVRSDPDMVSKKPGENDFTRPLTLWRASHLHVLKAVALKRSEKSNLGAAINFIEWQEKEAFFNASASLFCLAAMGHTPPATKMIKDIGSQDLEKLQKGIHNATWDIAILIQWGKWLRDKQAVSWLFSTNDKALKHIIKYLFLDDDSDTDAQFIKFLRLSWGKKDAVRLKETYDKSRQSVGNDATRQERLATAFAAVGDQILELECQLGLMRNV